MSESGYEPVHGYARDSLREYVVRSQALYRDLVVLNAIPSDPLPTNAAEWEAYKAARLPSPVTVAPCHALRWPLPRSIEELRSRGGDLPGNPIDLFREG